MHIYFNINVYIYTCVLFLHSKRSRAFSYFYTSLCNICLPPIFVILIYMIITHRPRRNEYGSCHQTNEGNMMKKQRFND